MYFFNPGALFMKNLFKLLLAVYLTTTPVAIHAKTFLDPSSIPVYKYLDSRVDKNAKRFETFHEAIRLMNIRNIKNIVETGTQRCSNFRHSFDRTGDGGGTIIFAHWAKDHSANLYSVDIDKECIEISRRNTSYFGNTIRVILDDSVNFLANFSDQIDFLYLDSYDYDMNNPDPAQNHCLNEILASENKLHEQSVIMIDDCNIHRGGKGLLAIEYLKSKGWVLHKNLYQVILIRPGTQI